MRFQILVLVLVFSVMAFGQQGQQQVSPQQVVTSLVNQQAQLNASITTALNQIPDFIKQIQDLQAQVKDLQAQLAKKDKK